MHYEIPSHSPIVQPESRGYTADSRHHEPEEYRFCRPTPLHPFRHQETNDEQSIRHPTFLKSTNPQREFNVQDGQSSAFTPYKSNRQSTHQQDCRGNDYSNPFVPPPPADEFSASTKYLATIELKKAPAVQYTGDPYMYRTWISSILNRMRPLNLPAIDQIDVLQAHNAGPAQDLVQTFKTAHASNPKLGLEMIMHKLERRFGTEEEILSLIHI